MEEENIADGETLVGMNVKYIRTYLGTLGSLRFFDLLVSRDNNEST